MWFAVPGNAIRPTPPAWPGKAPEAGPVRYRLLGSMQILASTGEQARVTRPKHRQLLASLLLSGNAVVAADSLVEELWEGVPPASARGMLQTYVWGLRKLLAPSDPSSAPIQTAGRGYRFAVDRGDLDLLAFADLAQYGRKALRAGDLGNAEHLLGRALGLWRGAALEDVEMPAMLANTAMRLNDERVSVFEDWFEAHLALGWTSDVVSKALAWLDVSPFRERLCGQVMLALYRTGRQAEALHAYHSLRRHLAHDLGIEPNPTIRDLHERILAADPVLL